MFRQNVGGLMAMVSMSGLEAALLAYFLMCSDGMYIKGCGNDKLHMFAVERAMKTCGDLKGLEPAPVFACIGVGCVNVDSLRKLGRAAGSSASEQYFPLHVGFSRYF